MKLHFSRRALLAALGLISLIPYLYALKLQDLREHTVEFEFAFFGAFALYTLAVALVLREGQPTSPSAPSLWGKGVGGLGPLVLIFGFAILFRAVLIFTPPTLSDDMYRYVWDGRVQANGINPYAYPPAAPELRPLRDNTIWPEINRKSAVTVYPAGAELTYAALWRIWPDNVRWFQVVMAAGGLLAGVLLIPLLRALGRPAHLALIYLWNPLVIFETAHAAHVDGLVLPLLVAAWLARAKGRDALMGLFIGAATLLKLYPVVLLPILWRSRDESGRLRLTWAPVAFAAVLALAYVPYLAQGPGVIGFLPQYFNERFNMGLANLITQKVEQAGGQPERVINELLVATLAIIGLVFVLRPARSAEQAIRRCIWPIGVFTLLTQDLFPWYMLWLVPLLALFVQPGRLGLRFDAWTGWFLFSGLVALAYTFFIKWVPVTWALVAQFVPLYAFLILPAIWKAAKGLSGSRYVMREAV